MAYDINELKDLKELFGQKSGRSAIFNSALLLTIGAVISLLSTIVIANINNGKEEKAKLIAKKNEVLNNISVQFGKRFYRTSNLIKYYTPTRGDSISTNRYVKEYEERLYEWNSNKYVDINLIKLYFGEGASNSYIARAFNPLTDIGGTIIASKGPLTEDDRKALRDSLLGTDAAFQTLMYSLLEKTNKQGP